jgi:hypothetical protein
VIPVTVSLRKHGASKGASISFLLSTPQTGVDSFFVTYSLLGPVFAILRPLIAFITGIIGGAAVGAIAEKSIEQKQDAQDDSAENKCEDECCKKTKDSKFVRAFKYGFLTIPRDIGKPMLLGLIIAALISAFVPGDFVVEGVETVGTFGTMLIMMAIGIPVYVCATASVPLAAVMIMKGICPGAVLVFLMTGPATNAAAFATIWKVMGTRTALVYITTVIFCALGFGLLLEAAFPNLSVSIQEHFHEMGPTLAGHISAIVLLIVLLYGIYAKIRSSADQQKETAKE